jgi:hypothetical protein
VLTLQGHPPRHRFTERAAAADGLTMHFLESQVWNRARRYVRAMRRVISAFSGEPEACKGAGTGSVKLPRRLLDSALQRGQQGSSRATSARLGR